MLFDRIAAAQNGGKCLRLKRHEVDSPEWKDNAPLQNARQPSIAPKG